MGLELEGTLYGIFDAQTFGSGFTKREFVLETSDDQYPQKIKFELIKDGCSKLDAHNEGDKLKVHFNVRGREWTSPTCLLGWCKTALAKATWRKVQKRYCGRESNPRPQPC